MQGRLLLVGLAIAALAAAALSPPAVREAVVPLPPRPVAHVDEAGLRDIGLQEASRHGLEGAPTAYDIRHMRVGDVPVARVTVQGPDGKGYAVFIDEVEGRTWVGGTPMYRELTGQPLDYELVEILREGSTKRFTLLVTGLTDLAPPDAGPITCQPAFGCTFDGTARTLASLVANGDAASIALAEPVPGCLRGPEGSPRWDPSCVHPWIDATFRQA